MKKRVNLTIDTETYKLFQKYCADRGMKVSSRVELFMRKELKR